MAKEPCCVVANNEPSEFDAAYSQMCTSFVDSLKFEDIPERSITQMKVCLLDWLGCVIRGTARPQSEPAKKYIAHNMSAPQASMVCQDGKASITDAAFFNGYCGHIMEMDDVDRESISHPATVVIPAALSVGEWKGKSGKDLLTAIVAGYEIMLRVGAAVTPEHYKIWHTTATTGHFGSAMAAGKLLGLNKEQLDWTLGNAGTMAAGLWQFLQNGGMSKFLHAGKAASNGVLAAFMAENGFSGATAILEGSQGFFAGYARQAVKTEVFNDFGKYWRAGEVSIKPYPCCRHTHSAIDAANAIREQFAGIDYKSVEKVHAKTYDVAVQVAGIEDPQTPQECKFSLKFCIARTLMNGLVSEKDFTPETLHDPETRALMARIELDIVPELIAMLPSNWPSVMTATMQDGTELHAEVISPSGDPDNPVSWEGIVRKFKMMTDGILSDEACDEFADMCKSLENLENCGDLITAINRLVHRG